MGHDSRSIHDAIRSVTLTPRAVARTLSVTMRPTRARDMFAVGAVLGAVACFAYMIAGYLGLLPGLVLVAYSLTDGRTALPGVAGAVTGFGACWLVLVGQAAAGCTASTSCGMPDADRWLVIGGAILLAGLTLGLVALSRARAR